MAEDLLTTLHTRLLSGASATQALADWCRENGLAANPRIVARLAQEPEQPATAAQRLLLEATADEPVRYRRVQLCCAGHVLVEARNWYLPDRLDENMRRQLEETDTPFGAVVAPLTPVRRTLKASLVPDADALMDIHALVLIDGRPVAEVIERYTPNLLAITNKNMPEVR